MAGGRAGQAVQRVVDGAVADQAECPRASMRRDRRPCRGRARRLVAVALVAMAMSACGAATRPGAVTTVPAARSLPCHGPAGLVVWQPDGQQDQPMLDRWCHSVGPPVVDVAQASPAQVRRLLVLSWNAGVGAGRLAALVDLVRARAPTPASGDVGLVVLVQEAFRGGPDVPEHLPAGLDAPGSIRPGRPVPDIVEVARTLGMSLVYVPSMRNGPATSRYEREDRGNAILSTEPVTDVSAFELPFAKQRRVAVAATLTVRGSGGKVRVVAAHLDTPGRGTLGQAKALARFIAGGQGDVPVVLGIDTNALLGRSGPIVGQLEAALPLPPSCRSGRTGPWPFGRLDFVFTNLPEARTTCETLTDRYGSDHVPVLLTVDW
jgi:endonuclease/exonuclease/phosphatase family metal-dependent hydrolase